MTNLNTWVSIEQWTVPSNDWRILTHSPSPSIYSHLSTVLFQVYYKQTFPNILQCSTSAKQYELSFDGRIRLSTSQPKNVVLDPFLWDSFSWMWSFANMSIDCMMLLICNWFRNFTVSSVTRTLVLEFIIQWENFFSSFYPFFDTQPVEHNSAWTKMRFDPQKYLIFMNMNSKSRDF